MRIEFTFSRDAEYFRRQLIRTARNQTMPLVLLGSALLGVGIAALVGYRAETAGLVTGVVLALAGVVVLYLRSARVAFMVTVPLSWQAPRRWLVTDDGVESRTEQSSATYEWSAFRTGMARDNAYVLVRDGQTLVDIPRRPLTPEQDAQLRAFLSARGLLGATGGR